MTSEDTSAADSANIRMVAATIAAAVIGKISLPEDEDKIAIINEAISIYKKVLLRLEKVEGKGKSE
jgi:hypothetical protein